MKRILSLVLSIALIFVFAACGDKDTASTDSGKPDSSAAEFTKPENYASVVLVTINPQFKLYLDVAGEVLAVEPVNDDAKSIADGITTQTGNIEKVIESIVSATNDGGFVKENATVNFEITEIKDTAVDTEAVLSKAKTSADDSFKELKITIEIKTSVSENAINAGASGNTSSDASSTESNTPPVNSNSSANTQSQPTHTHSYSVASCTNPPVCSCGAVGGTALGHSYKDGTCSRCGAKDPNFSYTAVSQKNGRWTFNYLSDGCLYKARLFLHSGTSDLSISVSIGDPISGFTAEEQENMKTEPNCEKFGNEYYWVARGTGDGLASATENANTVTVTDLSGNQLVLTRTGENNMTVQSAPTDFAGIGKIPVGTLLTFAAVQ